MTTKDKKKILSRDPFYEPSLHKAFYHPSRLKDVGKKKKQEGVLSAARHNDLEDEKSEKDKLSQADMQFLKSGAAFKNKFNLPTENGSPRDNSEKFDESWPVTERPSSLSLPGVSPASATVHHETDDLDPVKSRLDFQEEENKYSTLSKYIDRFRKGPPMSRDEREKFLETSRKKDFWWLNGSQSGPSDSSTPKSERAKGQGRSRSPRSPTASRVDSAINVRPGQRSLGHDGRSRGHDGRSTSPMLRNLSDKADRLLEKIDSSYLTSDVDGAVSTLGLGSSPSESTFEVQEQPYRPSFTRINQSDAGLKLFMEKPARPEDDILHHWRMRRKLELAREKASVDRYSSSKTKTPGSYDSLSAFRSRLAQEKNNNEILEPVAATKPKGGKDTAGNSIPIQMVDANSPTERKEIETQTVNREQETPPSSPEKLTDVPVIIASPQLGRKSTTNKYPVPPHVHLSCDIIPCHHGNDHHGCNQSGHMFGCHGNKQHKEAPSGRLSPQKSGLAPAENKLEDDLDEKPTKESSDFEVDSDYEKYKRDHLLALHREIEESLNSDTYSIHSNDSDRKIKSDSKRSKSRELQNIPEMDSKSQRRKRNTNKENDKTDIRQSRERLSDTPDFMIKKGQTDDDESVKRVNRKLPKQRHLGGDERSSVDIHSSSEFEVDLTERNGRKRSTSKERPDKKHSMKDKRNSSPTGISLEKSKDTSKTVSNSKTASSKTQRTERWQEKNPPEKNLTPVPSDGQPQSSVGSTIGQVVNERLFLGASVSSTEYQRAAPPSQTQSVQPPTLQDLKELVSDDESFSDDDMLQELRKKRKYFLDKLKEIELLLLANS